METDPRCTTVIKKVIPEIHMAAYLQHPSTELQLKHRAIWVSQLWCSRSFQYFNTMASKTVGKMCVSQCTCWDDVWVTGWALFGSQLSCSCNINKTSYYCHVPWRIWVMWKETQKDNKYMLFFIYTNSCCFEQKKSKYLCSNRIPHVRHPV